jgi:hypothetical protein
MGYIGKGMVGLSSQTTEDKKAYLKARASRFNGTPSTLVSNLVDLWLALGAPPLCEEDSLETPLPIPAEISVRLRPYWAHLVPFEVDDDRAKAGKPSAKDVAQHLLNRPRKGARAKGRSDPSNHSSHTRT